ncbi:MFS transporter, partial [Actinomyces sp.]
MTTKSSAPTKSIPPLVIRSAIVASLGGLLFGFDTAVISGAEEKLTELYALSSMGEGMIVAIATIGTICGAIVAGKLADRFGRKPILFWIGILFGVGALATALAPVPTLNPVGDGKFVAASSFPITFFMVFRFLGGVGVGLSSVVAPIYTAEIAPARVRGRLVGLVQFNIVFGILLAYASNAVIREIAHEDTAWRWMLGVMAVPAVFFLIFLATVPETPRWLLAHGHEERAVKISERLTSSQEESTEQINEIKAQIAEDAAGGKVAFFTRRYRKVILMAFCIAMFNQLSGINAILYYAPKVMK